MRKTSCVLLFLTVFLLKPEFLTAQNLLTNGEFDSDTNGWVGIPSTTLTWVSDDGAPTSGNGSMMNTNSFNNGGSFPAISEKMAVIPNHWYLTGFSYKVPTDSPVSWVLYQFHWYDDLNNQIGFSDIVGTDFNFPRDVWENFTGLNQVPELATQGELRIYFQSGVNGETDLPYGFWDDVSVFKETIYVDGFD